MPVRQWDGDSYDRVSDPMVKMGREVLARLPLAGGERVLDAGCGSGRITEELLARLPHGQVIAVDLSPSMLAAAERRLARPIAEGRVELHQADLLELALETPADAVLSTATFHWISDHDRLFARLHAALRAGGRLVAQCGGQGNIASLRGRAAPLLERDPYARHFAHWRPPWNYAAAEPTRERLLRAGFASAKSWLSDAPQRPEQPREFLAEVVFGPHLQRLPEELRAAFTDELVAAVGEPVVVDYVRLNVDAVA
jgi:trans-aconitate 2-methyltransferase